MNDKTNRFGKTKFVLKEISTYTFLKRGISANLRALDQGKEFYIDSLKSFKQHTTSMKDRDGENTTLDSLDDVHRKVLLANAILTITLHITLIFSVMMILVSSLIRPEVQAFIRTTLESPLLFYSSCMVSILGIIYTVFNAIITYHHIDKLIAITNLPHELCNQYRASFDFVTTVFLINLAICYFFQTAPEGILVRTTLGIIAVTSSIGIYRSFRSIYNPTLPYILADQSLFNRIIRYSKVLTGGRVLRVHEDNNSDTPYFKLSAIIIVSMLVLFTKDFSLISIITTVPMITGLAITITMFINGWVAQND